MSKMKSSRNQELINYFRAGNSVAACAIKFQLSHWRVSDIILKYDRANCGTTSKGGRSIHPNGKRSHYSKRKVCSWLCAEK